VQELRFPAIAGIQVVHSAPDGLEVGQAMPSDWAGSRITDEPIRIEHTVGDTTPVGLRALVAAPPPYGTYYLDAAGNLAIRSSAVDPDGPFQLLLTRRSGYEYELRHERADQPTPRSWKWPRTVFLAAYASRGRGLGAHACGFLLPDGQGVLCPGTSGAGKSTLAKLFASEPALGVTVLSDDRIAISAEASGIHIWGTPWHSAAMAASDRDGPLRAILFLRHGSAPSVRAVAPGDAARRLMRTLVLPFWSNTLMDQSLQLLDAIVTTIPSLEFSYAPSPDAAHWLCRELGAERREASPA
jgi:hypothetical protein